MKHAIVEFLKEVLIVPLVILLTSFIGISIGLAVGGILLALTGVIRARGKPVKLATLIGLVEAAVFGVCGLGFVRWFNNADVFLNGIAPVATLKVIKFMLVSIVLIGFAMGKAGESERDLSFFILNGTPIVTGIVVIGTAIAGLNDFVLLIRPYLLLSALVVPLQFFVAYLVFEVFCVGCFMFGALGLALLLL